MLDILTGAKDKLRSECEKGFYLFLYSRELRALIPLNMYANLLVWFCAFNHTSTPK